MVLLYRAGKALAAEPAIISVLAEHGQWDDTPFVNRIESGYFGLIVSSRFPLTERLMFSPAVQAAIERAYEPRERIGAYTLTGPVYSGGRTTIAASACGRRAGSRCVPN